MGFKIMLVSLDAIKAIFCWKTGFAFKVKEGMPADARVVSAKLLLDSGQLELKIFSESFPDNKNDVFEFIVPVIERIDEKEAV